ncbi:MAG TPA: ABC transporter ATP-binding protein [Pirellulaceae bacterium]|nr:ABC transporter ATP-binding protein [Pirellulaceae bacterium]
MLRRPASSRVRFRELQRELNRRIAESKAGLSKGGKPRDRSATVLVREFFALARDHRAGLAATLGALTFATALALVPPAASKFLIDHVLQGIPVGDEWPSFVPRDPRRLLAAICVTVLVASVLNTAIGLWSRWQATRITKRLQLSVRRKVFAHVMRLPLARVQGMKAGGASSLLRQDAGSVGDLVFGMLYNPWQALVQLIGSLIVLAWVDWKLLLGSLVLVPIVYLTHRAWIARIRPEHRQVRALREEADAAATESFAGVRIVRGFSGQRAETSRIMRLNDLLGRQEIRSWWWMRAIELVWATLIPAATAGLMFYGGWNVLQGTLTLGDLMMFLAYLLMLLGPLATLAQSAASFQDSLSGLDRVLDVLAEPLELEPHRGTRRADPERIRGEIEFDRVTFRYESASRDALTELSLTIPAGTMVALVGPSGAGKTTLCNLVARFYDPTAGTIRVDGIDLRDFDVETYRRALAIVEQDVFLFDGTVAENIAFGNRHADDAAIREACRIAAASEFIERLPQGYDTRIGERGVRLSGGQRQRLAIARAIVADPRILILDEATSNLDTESEREIQAGLESLTRGRTCLVIAHRLSTVASADRILVIDDGRIIEQGTHAVLMDRDGRYREMVRLQTEVGEERAGAVRETTV